MGTNRPTSGQVLTSYLHRQHRRIARGLADLADPAVGDRDRIIHRTRVAARRMRSTVRVFADFVDADEAGRLDAELAWLSGILGAVRDPQVLRRRLTRAVDTLPVQLRMGPVQASIDAELRSQEATAEQRLVAALTGRRCAALLRRTARWATAAPFTARSDEPAKALVTPARKAGRRPAKRLTAADELVGSEQQEMLHRARKSAKRARYAAEVVREVVEGKHGRRAVQRFRRWQDVLGEHQDGVLAADLLLRLGRVHGVRPGENGFAFGVLHEQQTARAAAAHDRARSLAAE